MASVPMFHRDVQAQKADAMRKCFENCRKFQDLVPTLEVTVALALLLWYFAGIPAAMELARKYVRRLSSHGLFVFAVVNALVILIFSLSKPNRKGRAAEPDIYEEYFSVAAEPDGGRSPAVKEERGEPERSERADPVPAVVQETESGCESGSPPLESVHQAVGPKQKKQQPARFGSSKSVGSVKQVKQYRRSRSERLDGERTMRLRRWCAMDDLSSEEFRVEVESFIASKKMTLLRENVAV